MGKKKKGSSFIMVVFVTAIIFTTATTMIAVVTSDYKNRVNQSKILQNLYQSEAGIDIVNNVIAKNCDAAIVYANYKAKSLTKSTIDTIVKTDYTDSKIYNAINGKFKEQFIEFLGEANKDNITSSTSGIVQETDKMVYGIANNKYIYPKPEGDVTTGDYGVISSYGWNDIDRTISTKQKSVVEIEKYEVALSKKSIVITVKSTFTTENAVDNMNNKKTIRTKFTVTVPEYSEGISTTAQPETVYKYPIQKAIVADGNLNVDGGITNVTGEVWIKGSGVDYTSENAIYAYEKHKSGIHINNSTFDVDGNVYTSNTFQLQNSANSTVTNLYALNAYVGRNSSSDLDKSENNHLTVKAELITNNDLTLNSKNSTIDIKDYFGINDTTEDANYRNASSELVPAKSSSSIIVNDYIGSTLKIEKAYVMGVGYIEMKNKSQKSDNFKTGESVAIKGNYLAYTDKLDNETNVTIHEYNPLQLLETVNGKSMTTEQKAEHFQDYWSDKEYENGGVTIKTLNSLAAYATTDGIGKGNITIEESTSTIKPKKEAFATKVFSMGDITGLTGNPTKETVYKGNVVVKSVHNQVEWDSTKKFIPTKANDTLFSEAGGKLIYNTTEADDIIIENNVVTINGVIVIDGTKASDGTDLATPLINAVIITKGNVIIKGNLNYIGSIIAGGNVTIQGTGTKTIEYNEVKVLETTAKYNNKLVGIFKGAPLNNSETNVNVTKKVAAGSTSLVANQRYDTNLLKIGLWKLEK